MDIQKEVIQIAKDISKKNISDHELLSADYADKGIFDSFQIIELITKLEETFKIQFSSDDMASDSFKTLSGISALVKDLLSKK